MNYLDLYYLKAAYGEHLLPIWNIPLSVAFFFIFRSKVFKYDLSFLAGTILSPILISIYAEVFLGPEALILIFTLMLMLRSFAVSALLYGFFSLKRRWREERRARNRDLYR